MKTLVLGLGNELLADDAVGIHAARELERRVADRAEVVTTALHGLALLDVLAGYDAAVIVDAVLTGRHPVGEVFEIDPTALRPIAGASPHFAGLPELLALADRLGLQFPTRLRVVAVEVRDLHTVGGAMTPEVSGALPRLCDAVVRALDDLHASAGSPGGPTPA